MTSPSPSSPSNPSPLLASFLRPLLVFLSALVFLPTLFLLTIHTFPTYFAPTKRRSGILSFVVSASMTVISLPFVWDFLSAGGNVSVMDGRRAGGEGWGTEALGEVVCMGFAAYCLCDLGMGWGWYRQVSIMLGFRHPGGSGQS